MYINIYIYIYIYLNIYPCYTPVDFWKQNPQTIWGVKQKYDPFEMYLSKK